MTFLLRWRRRIFARQQRPTVVVPAVSDSDLPRILEDLGLLRPFERGELHCPVTGQTLCWNNLGGLIGSTNGPRLVSEQGLLALASGSQAVPESKVNPT